MCGLKISFSSLTDNLFVLRICEFLIFTIGQGKEECFISQPLAKLYSFVVPVALVLLFNLLALGHTVSRIVKTRKVYADLIDLFSFDHV